MMIAITIANIVLWSGVILALLIMLMRDAGNIDADIDELVAQMENEGQE